MPSRIGQPEQQLQDQRERVQVHAGDQHRGDRERQRVEDVGRLVEAQPQVLRHAAHLGAVVEGHHHEAQEDHRRHRADPVVVDRRVDAELRAVGGHPEDLERAEVGRDERQAGDPRGQRPAGQEVVQARLDVALRGEPDPEDEDEVDRQDHVVDEVRVQPDVVHFTLPLSKCLRRPYPATGSSNRTGCRWRARLPNARALGRTTRARSSSRSIPIRPNSGRKPSFHSKLSNADQYR